MGRFAAGLACGVAGAAAVATIASPVTPPVTLRPVTVTLHRFDRKPGSERTFTEWIAFLHARHREAVATLARERTYAEAMFTAPDEPTRLYWLTVTGEGGAGVESSDLDLDRRHTAYMAATLVDGSHRRLTTDNVLAPDFIVGAIASEQRREGR